MSSNKKIKNKMDSDKVSKDKIEKCKHTFECLLIEYNDIIANGRNIDTKAGLFLTLLFAILPFYIQIIDIDFLKIVCDFNPPTIPKCFFVFFFVISIASYIITFIFYVLALYPRNFNKLANDTEKLSDYYYIEKEFLKGDLVKDYQDGIRDLSVCIEPNFDRSHMKASWFKRALISFIVYNGLIILVIFLKLFLKF